MDLLKLMSENKGLPVVPMVDAATIGDDYGYYIGSWGDAYVDEYLIAMRDRRVCFKSDDDVFDTLEGCLSDEEYNALPDTEFECRARYDALPWKKAIIVYIRPYTD